MKNPPNNVDPIYQGAGFRLFQDSLDPIIITDIFGSILIANKRAENLFERSSASIIGQKISGLHQESNHLPNFATLPDETVKQFDSIIQLPSENKTLYMEVFARRYKLNGHPIVQWIHHDITRQVELDQLRQDLAAMLVHDLQSPLGNVISSLEIIRNELDPDASDSMHAMVDVAVRSSHYLQTLVESLLDISHLEAGRPLENLELININQVFDFVASVQAPDLEQRNVTLVSEIEPDSYSITADRNVLQRILLNLLNNALKYSHSGQTITMGACNVPNERFLLVSVIDQGPGVPDPYHEIIFEKFQRVNNNSPSSGLGLGLAFCHLAVKAHGGRIWVENSSDGGACFYFTIPAAATPDPVSMTTTVS